MKLFKIVSLLVGFSLFTACHEDAKSALGSLYDVAKTQDLNGLREMLTGEALEEFGNEGGLMALGQFADTVAPSEIKGKNIKSKVLKRERKIYDKLSCHTSVKEDLVTKRVSKITLKDDSKNVFFSAVITCNISYKKGTVYFGGKNPGWKKCLNYDKSDCVFNKIEL